MKKENKKFVLPVAFAATACAIAFAVLPSAGVTANANSGPSHWSGVTASGTVFSGDNCPIEVESEVLTFNIPQFLYHGSAKEEMINYKGKFTAEYTFKNPTQDKVSATLAFPLGGRSDYGYYDDDGKYVYLDDLFIEKGMYNVSVGGEKVEAQMRRTFHALNDFDFSSEIKQIAEGYKPHEFFSLDLPVYIYYFGFVSEFDGYFQAEATLNNAGNARFAGSYGYLDEAGGKTKITYSVLSDSEIELFSIGAELDPKKDINWRFYKKVGYFNNIEKAIEATAVVSDKVEETTFKNFVFSGYEGGNDASEVEKADFYNAALDYIDEYLETSMLPKSFAFLQNSNYLMRWLVYDLDFGAGQTVTNTVSAPVFSGGYYYYTPYVYTYSYLLSPAQQWGDFKNLEIRINTPYYLVNTSFMFEKTDCGYVYKSDELPSGELEFELCEVENPERDNRGTAFVAFFIILGICAYAIPVVIGIAIIIIVLVFAMRYKKKNNGKNVSGSFKPLKTFEEDGGGSQE